MKLTDASVAALRRRGARVEVWDVALAGLFARSTRRAMSFGVRYRSRGRQIRFKIGSLPPMTLKEIKDRARHILARIALGEDPQLEREAKRRAPDLKAVCAAFVTGRRGLAASTIMEYKRIARAYVDKASISNIPTAELLLGEIRAFLDDVAENHGETQANRVFQFVRAACRWARREELLVRNPAEGLQRPCHENARERVLSDDEVIVLWRILDRAPDVPAAAVKLLLLLGQRSGETIEMRWEHVDLAAGLWTIPGLGRKGGRLHVVPLPPQAIAIIEGLRGRTGARPRVLAGISNHNPQRDWWGTIRDSVMAQLPTGTAGFTRHDLRRTCATGCARLGAAPEVVSRILGHALYRGGPVVTGTYDRYDRLAEKLAALMRWATWVEGLGRG